MKTKFYAFLIMALTSSSALQAKDVSWVPLFDGKTLKSWNNPYTQGEATVVNGEIHLVSDKKFFLCTEKIYSDFTFEGDIILPEGPSNFEFMFRSHVEPNNVYGNQGNHLCKRRVRSDYTDEMTRRIISASSTTENKVRLINSEI